MALIHEDLSRQVLGAAFKVHSALGEGLAEQVYERSLLVELRSRGLLVEQQVSYPVSYQGVAVGVFRADLVVAGTIIVELKAVAQVTSAMVSQLYNYLKLSHVPLGYILNFHAPSLWYQRVVYGRGAGG